MLEEGFFHTCGLNCVSIFEGFHNGVFSYCECLKCDSLCHSLWQLDVKLVPKLYHERFKKERDDRPAGRSDQTAKN
jgi:hypothetical protein